MASAFVKGLSIVVCLVTLIKSTEGLSCSYCDYDAACPKGHLTESDCPFGVVKDICQCCDTCAKIIKPWMVTSLHSTLQVASSTEMSFVEFGKIY
ncbi:venom protein 302-like isoform X2 [Palaemon carinicauda]|uniref:venom protein 302-like isoform X2 n=1 Tax=Palaemon carinicauda TaxID=392227 RepID=UPI0035B5E389